MDRGRFVTIVAGAVLTVPFVVEGQPNSKRPKVGLLNGATAAAAMHNVEAFRQGFRELGYVEGKTLDLVIRHGDGKPERFRELARELVALKMDVIVASTVPGHRGSQTRNSNDPDRDGA